MKRNSYERYIVAMEIPTVDVIPVWCIAVYAAHKISIDRVSASELNGNVNAVFSGPGCVTFS